MKIIHIVESLDVSHGGPAICVPLLAKHLNSIGCSSVVLSVQATKEESDSIVSKDELKIVKVPLTGFKKIKYSSKLKSEIINEITKDTIIHVHSIWTYPSYAGYKISKDFGVPLVVSVRGTMYKWAMNKSKYVKLVAMWLYQRRILNYANKIHITEIGEKEAMENIGIFNDKMLVPDGVSIGNKPDDLNKKILKSVEFNKNKRYIFFLGRIVPNKGVHFLLNSFKILKHKYKDVEVIIGGSFNDSSYCSSLEKIDGVHFVGMLNEFEKHTMFSISTLFVLPTVSENFGLVVAEAMSYKIPVITTTGAPWADILKFEAGWWVDLTEFNIFNAIDEALSLNSEELARKGKNGYALVQNFSWDKQALEMKKHYESIL
jgi:glycosyltransferase involved in cell wall biosynthesis